MRNSKKLERRKRRKALVLNNGNKQETILKLTANFDGMTRNEELNDRDYLVAPMIMIVEGVLNGSQGPLFYPEEELSKTPEVWNAKPTIVYHPEDGASACTPLMMQDRQIGMIMNTEFTDGKLKAEAWLEIDRVEQVDERVLSAVENNEMMELSTGVFIDVEPTKGVWEGVPYDGIARNYRPDHLAILPDLTGACSVKDGAGFLRLNDDGTKFLIDVSKIENKERVKLQINEMIENELSHDDIWGLLNSALFDVNPDFWIDVIFDDFLIYRNDGKLFLQEYSMLEDKVTLVGSPEEVTKKTQFLKLDGTVVNETVTKRKGKNMKKTIVNKLIANEGTQWTEEDRQLLMNMEKDTLEKMLPIVNEEEDDGDDDVEAKAKAKAKKEEAAANKAKEDAKAKEDDDKTTENKVQTPDEYINDAPEALQGVLRNGLNSYEAGKKLLIAKITTNKLNKFTAEELGEKDLGELQKIAAMASNGAAPETPVLHDYSGLGEVADNDADEVTPLALPVHNFEPEQKK